MTFIIYSNSLITSTINSVGFVIQTLKTHLMKFHIANKLYTNVKEDADAYFFLKWYKTHWSVLKKIQFHLCRAVDKKGVSLITVNIVCFGPKLCEICQSWFGIIELAYGHGDIIWQFSKTHIFGMRYFHQTLNINLLAIIILPILPYVHMRNYLTMVFSVNDKNISLVIYDCNN